MSGLSAFLSLPKRFLSAAAMPQKRIELFYDVVSPYSWFAFEVLMRYKKHWNIAVELKPFFLAGVTKATGNSAPMLVPNKGLYMFSDLQRNARYFDVPLKLVSDPHAVIMVKGSLLPNRFLTAIDLLFPNHVEAVSRELWMALWNKDEDFTAPEILARAGQAGGLSQEQLKQVQGHMTAQVTKDRLKAYTDQAVEYGAFGSPTIVVHAEGEPMLFFGSDRFPVMANEIGEKWLGPDPEAAHAKL